MITTKENFQNKGTTVCLLRKKSKKLNYNNLYEKKITDNKTFWKAVKPFLSDKIVSGEKVTLIEEDGIVERDINTAQILNTFFSNMVNNLKIAKYANCDPISENINDPVIKSIIKYRNHPGILKIGEVCNRKQ